MYVRVCHVFVANLDIEHRDGQRCGDGGQQVGDVRQEKAEELRPIEFCLRTLLVLRRCLWDKRGLSFPGFDRLGGHGRDRREAEEAKAGRDLADAQPATTAIGLSQLGTLIPFRIFNQIGHTSAFSNFSAKLNILVQFQISSQT